MTRSTTILLLGAVALATVTMSVPAAQAAALPQGAAIKAAVPETVTVVNHRRWHRQARYRYRHRAYVVVRPRPAPGYYDPRQAPGFHDPGYAYRGNINGCSVDLGYGRYEPCNGR